jgi:hypothetical protein
LKAATIRGTQVLGDRSAAVTGPPSGTVSPGISRKLTAGALIHISVIAPPSVRARYVAGPREVLVPWARQTRPGSAGGRSVGGAAGRVGEAEVGEADVDRLGGALAVGDPAVDAELVAGPGPPAAAFEHAASATVSATISAARTARDRLTAHHPMGARSVPTSAVI